MTLLDALNPYRWLLAGALFAALVLGVPLIVHRYDEARRDEGREEIRELARRAAEQQKERNLQLQRAAEKRYVVRAAAREELLVTTRKEIDQAPAPSGPDCRLDPRAVRLLNAAAACTRSDPAATCGPGDGLPDPR